MESTKIIVENKMTEPDSKKRRVEKDDSTTAAPSTGFTFENASLPLASTGNTNAAPPTEFVMGMQAPSAADTNNGEGPMDLEEVDLNESKKIMLKLLVQVGSDPKVERDVVASQQLPMLAGAIAGDVEDGLGDYISSTFLDCIVGFPHKFDVYAGLLGCINEEDGEFAEQIVQATMVRLEDALESGATRDVKVLLRFFVLWPTVKISTMNATFDALTGLVGHVREALAAAPQSLKIQLAADEVIGAVVFALMCGGRALAETSNEGKTRMESLLSNIQQEYMTETRQHRALPSSTESIYPNAPSLRDCDALENIVACLSETVKNSFDNSRLAERSFNVVKASSSTLEEAETMDIPSWTGRVSSVVTWSDIVTKSCTREVRLFGDGGRSKDDFSWGDSYRSKTLSKLSVSDRFALRDVVYDLLMTHAPRSDETVSALLRCSMPGTEHVVLETILKVMLEPPYLLSSSRWLFYGGIIVRICKASKDYPPTLAETFDVLFRGVAGLPPNAPANSEADATAGGAKQSSASLAVVVVNTGTLSYPSRTRLCTWFAWHLSQLKWNWPWKRLSPCIHSVSASDPRRQQRTFMHNVFRSLFTYNYHEMLKSQNVIPHEFGACMPTIINRPTNRYTMMVDHVGDVVGPPAEEVEAYRATYEKLRSVFSSSDGPQWGDGGLLEWCTTSKDSPPMMRSNRVDAERDGGEQQKEGEKGKEGGKGEDEEGENGDTTSTEQVVVTDTATTVAGVTNTRDSPKSNPTAVHIMMTVLLQSGHKTLTHAMARVDRFGLMLYKMQRTHGVQKSGIAIVDACYSFFSDNPHYFFCVVDGMIQREYLSVGAFARWVCSRTTEVLLCEYQYLEYLNVSLERSVTGQYTRDASTASNVPKPETDEMQALVTEEERKDNVYNVFDALRAALNDANEDMTKNSSEKVDKEMASARAERVRLLTECGAAMSSMAKSATTMEEWDFEKMSI